MRNLSKSTLISAPQLRLRLAVLKFLVEFRDPQKFIAYFLRERREQTTRYFLFIGQSRVCQIRLNHPHVSRIRQRAPTFYIIIVVYVVVVVVDSIRVLAFSFPCYLLKNKTGCCCCCCCCRSVAIFKM